MRTPPAGAWADRLLGVRVSDEAAYMQDYRDEDRWARAHSVRVPYPLAGRALSEEEIDDAIEDARSER